MKRLNRKKSVGSKQKRKGCHLLLASFKQQKMQYIFVIIFVLSALYLAVNWILGVRDDIALKKQQEALQDEIQMTTEQTNDNGADPVILSEYKGLYEENKDFIGWLKIADTVIDYPVMQCMEDENYYLNRDFYKEDNKNGCLILDNDSNAGVGSAEQQYAKGTKPSTNLIIHGHTMKSGEMFGNLKLYEDEEYGLSHKMICFDSLYEKREYELIAAFYSQVYYQSEEVFKYYKFFQADTQEEFDDWYNNIKELSLYDTGVTAEFGDEFITLSCCAYHVEDGRFVVVGKRIN